MPHSAASLAARGRPRATDLRRHLGHHRRRRESRGADRLRIAHLRSALRARRDRRRGSAGHRRIPRPLDHQPLPAPARRLGRAGGPHPVRYRRELRPRPARGLLRRARRRGHPLRRLAVGTGAAPARAPHLRQPAARARRPPEAAVRDRRTAAPQPPGGERWRSSRGIERTLRPDFRCPPAGVGGAGNAVRERRAATTRRSTSTSAPRCRR